MYDGLRLESCIFGMYWGRDGEEVGKTWGRRGEEVWKTWGRGGEEVGKRWARGGQEVGKRWGRGGEGLLKGWGNVVWVGEGVFIEGTLTFEHWTYSLPHGDAP